MKKITLLLLLLALPILSFGQENINTSFSQEMEQVFAGLEKERVPYGILLDFGMEFTNVPAFNGMLTDSTYVSFFSLQKIYKTLLTSRIRDVNEGFVHPEDFSQNWRDNRSGDYIALSGLYFKYSRFAPDAYPGRINFADSLISDKYIEGVWQNPYEEASVFALAPPLYVHKGLDVQVKLPQGIFYSNDADNIQSLEIDFSDGQGYRSVNYGQLLDVHYAEEGIKTWKYKLVRNNGETMFAHSRIKIEKGLSLSTAVECEGLYAVSLTADLAYLNQYGEVTITVDRADGNCDITKPLIVAEGFDVGTLLNPENAFGMSDIATFYSDVNDSESFELENLLIGNTEFIYNDQQYDIIYVDWNNGADYLQRNAYALEKVIEWVNNEKTGNEPNVVLGQSMGGVIARYALTDMEVRGLNHDTRLFISQDAPQQGANVPLSLQFMYRHMTNQYIVTSTTLFGGLVTVPLLNDQFNVTAYLSILDAPASRQLLKVWSDLSYNVNYSMHDSFYNELRNLNSNNGYPQDPGIRNIAISNGSGCGSKIYNANGMLFNLSYDKSLSFWGNVLSMIYQPLGGLIGGLFLDDDFFGVGALGMIPGSSRYIVDFEAYILRHDNAPLYKGLVLYQKKIFGWVFPQPITDVQKNQPPGLLDFDTFGGGYFSLESISVNLNAPGLVLDIADRFSFVPTVSALDIGNGTTTLDYFDYRSEYVGGNPPIAPKSSPFDNFITAFSPSTSNSTNQLHISFQVRNGNWLAEELQIASQSPIYPIADCALLCSGTNVSGNGVLCDSETYSVPQNLGVVTWVISGNGLVSWTINGNSITITRNGSSSNGEITLVANYDTSTCEGISDTRQIIVGAPHLQNTGISGAPSVPVWTFLEPYTAKSPIHPGAQYIWSINYGTYSGTNLPVFTQSNLNTLTTTDRTVTIEWGNVPGRYLLRCEAENQCGNFTLGTVLVTVEEQSDGGGDGDPCDDLELRVSPNPTSGTINVEGRYAPFDPPCPPDYGNPINNFVTIHDLFGNLRYSENFETMEFTIADLNLESGDYILNLTTSNGKRGQEVIIVE